MTPRVTFWTGWTLATASGLSLGLGAPLFVAWLIPGALVLLVGGALGMIAQARQ